MAEIIQITAQSTTPTQCRPLANSKRVNDHQHSPNNKLNGSSNLIHQAPTPQSGKGTFKQ